MTRIGKRFEALQRDGKKAFVGFVIAGDVSLDHTAEVAFALEAGGCDILELGVPFSDPLADGPVIQRASERALRQGTTLAGVLESVRRIRRRSALPLVLFSYVNPLLRYGLDRVAAEARDSGVDGVLVTDLPPEEGGEWLEVARKADLDYGFEEVDREFEHVVSQLTTDELRVYLKESLFMSFNRFENERLLSVVRRAGEATESD